MEGYINSEQAISIMEARSSNKNAIPFTITFVSKEGVVREWENCILAKNKTKVRVKSRKGSKLLKFYLQDTDQIRNIHFWQIIAINHIKRQP